MNDYGILSILPPILSVVLAIVTRKVILSLALGVFLGMTIYQGFNPFQGLISVVELGLFAQLSKPSNAQIIILIAIIGGFVYQLEASGGMESFAKKIASKIKDPVKAQLSVWMAGLCIFFTDTGNALILGPIFQPIFIELKICKEKLAYIIDSTSSPICVLIPVIGWGVYIMSLMEQSFAQISNQENVLDAFLNVIPYQFYPLLALASVPILALTKKDYGPMAIAQKTVYYTKNDDKKKESPLKQKLPNGDAKTIIFPLCAMFCVLGGLFFYYYWTIGSLPGSKIRTALFIAYFIGAVVCTILLKVQKVRTLKESLGAFLKGMERMLFIIIVMLLAWSLGDVCKLLHTTHFISNLVVGTLPPAILPAILFCLGAIISLSTGSSYGTFAILMPIAIPLAYEINAPMYISIAGVLSGGILGDHSSPISDTTILSSMSTGCKHADHVNTQLPYALLTGSAALISFIIAGITQSYYSLLFGIVFLTGLIMLIMRLFGKSLKGTSKIVR